MTTCDVAKPRPAWPLPVGLAAGFLAVLAWSAVGPKDRLTWWLEVAPALAGVAAAAATWRRFRLTSLLYVLIFLHACILLVGGHYTYAEVPAFNWLRDTLHMGRNQFDRLGHFAQGFVPALLARELLLRTSPLRPGKWLFTLIVLSCLGISAAYELIEWAAAVCFGHGADAFLGAQGDVWDTQKDMLMCLVGAVHALFMLRRLHDRQLARLAASARSPEARA